MRALVRTNTLVHYRSDGDFIFEVQSHAPQSYETNLLLLGIFAVCAKVVNVSRKIQTSSIKRQNTIKSRWTS